MRAIGICIIVLLGLALAVLGIASVLNRISLRALLIHMELWQAFLLAEGVHAMLRHRVVQGLELAFGLLGLALVGGAAWWLMTRGRRGRGADEARLGHKSSLPGQAAFRKGLRPTRRSPPCSKR